MAAVLAATLPHSRVQAAETAHYASSQAALELGLKLYKSGDFANALPPLEFAAADNQFLAQFTLAQIYADNNGTETDHAKAYMLYQSIADEHSDADPDDDRSAPYVAKALTALAGYLQVGLPEIGVKPDPSRAADYLHHAALFFGDEDAQFELVKLKLSGEGVPTDIVSAKHWLAVLSQRGHAGAQAFLADLYWRGKFMEADKVRAFALISVAVEHAPPRERIWIEDVYQNIFCGAGEGIRRQATGMVADWRARYGRKVTEGAEAPLDSLYPRAVRTCRNGEQITSVEFPSEHEKAPATGAPPLTSPPARSPDATQPAGMLSPPAAMAVGPTPGGLQTAGSRSIDMPPTPGLAQSLIDAPATTTH